MSDTRRHRTYDRYGFHHHVKKGYSDDGERIFHLTLKAEENVTYDNEWVTNFVKFLRDNHHIIQLNLFNIDFDWAHFANLLTKYDTNISYLKVTGEQSLNHFIDHLDKIINPTIHINSINLSHNALNDAQIETIVTKILNTPSTAFALRVLNISNSHNTITAIGAAALVKLATTHNTLEALVWFDANHSSAIKLVNKSTEKNRQRLKNRTAVCRDKIRRRIKAETHQQRSSQVYLPNNSLEILDEAYSILSSYDENYIDQFKHKLNAFKQKYSEEKILHHDVLDKFIVLTNDLLNYYAIKASQKNAAVFLYSAYSHEPLNQANMTTLFNFLADQTNFTSIAIGIKKITDPSTFFIELSHNQQIKEITLSFAQNDADNILAPQFMLGLTDLLTKRPQLKVTIIHYRKTLQLTPEDQDLLLETVTNNPKITNVNLTTPDHVLTLPAVNIVSNLNEFIQDLPEENESGELKQILSNIENRRDPSKMLTALDDFEERHPSDHSDRSFLNYQHYLEEQIKLQRLKEKFDVGVSKLKTRFFISLDNKISLSSAEEINELFVYLNTVHPTIQTLSFLNAGIAIDLFVKALTARHADGTFKTNIRSLELCFYNAKELQPFIPVLSTLTPIESLKIEKTHIDDEMAWQIARALVTSTTLQTLEITSACTSANGAQAFNQLLKVNKTLTEVRWTRPKPNVENVKEDVKEYEKEDVNQVLDEIEASAALNKQLIKSTNGESTNAINFNQYVVLEKQLIFLSFNANKFFSNADAGVADVSHEWIDKLFDYLATRPHITSITFNLNIIIDWKYLAEKLAENNGNNIDLLRIDFNMLKLDRTPLKKKLIGVFITHATLFTSLSILDLSQNNIDDKMAREMVQQWTHLKIPRLHMFQNDISYDGARALCELVKQNETLSEIDLSDNPISREEATPLEKKLVIEINHRQKQNELILLQTIIRIARQNKDTINKLKQYDPHKSLSKLEKLQNIFYTHNEKDNILDLCLKLNEFTKLYSEFKHIADLSQDAKELISLLTNDAVIASLQGKNSNKKEGQEIASPHIICIPPLVHFEYKNGNNRILFIRKIYEKNYHFYLTKALLANKNYHPTTFIVGDTYLSDRDIIGISKLLPEKSSITQLIIECELTQQQLQSLASVLATQAAVTDVTFGTLSADDETLILDLLKKNSDILQLEYKKENNEPKNPLIAKQLKYNRLRQQKNAKDKTFDKFYQKLDKEFAKQNPTSDQALTIPTDWQTISDLQLDVTYFYLENHRNITTLRCDAQFVENNNYFFQQLTDTSYLKEISLLPANDNADYTHISSINNFGIPLVKMLVTRPDLTVYLDYEPYLLRSMLLYVIEQAIENVNLTGLNFLPSADKTVQYLSTLIKLNQFIRDHLAHVSSEKDIALYNLKNELINPPNRQPALKASFTQPTSKPSTKILDILNHFQKTYPKHKILKSTDFNICRDSFLALVQSFQRETISSIGLPNDKTLRLINTNISDKMLNVAFDSLASDGLKNHALLFNDEFNTDLFIEKITAKSHDGLPITNICALEFHFSSRENETRKIMLDKVIHIVPQLRTIEQLSITMAAEDQAVALALITNLQKNADLRLVEAQEKAKEEAREKELDMLNPDNSGTVIERKHDLHLLEIRLLEIKGIALNSEAAMALEQLLIANPLLVVTYTLEESVESRLTRRIADRNEQNKKYANEAVNIAAKNLKIIERATKKARYYIQSQRETNTNTLPDLLAIQFAFLIFQKEIKKNAKKAANKLDNTVKTIITKNPAITSYYLDTDLFKFHTDFTALFPTSKLDVDKYHWSPHEGPYHLSFPKILTIADITPISVYLKKHPKKIKIIYLDQETYERNFLPEFIKLLLQAAPELTHFSLRDRHDGKDIIHNREDIDSIVKLLKEGKLEILSIPFVLSDEEVKMIAEAVTPFLQKLHLGKINPFAQLYLQKMLETNATLLSIEYKLPPDCNKNPIIKKRLAENHALHMYQSQKNEFDACCKGNVLAINTSKFYKRYGSCVDLDGLTLYLKDHRNIIDVQITRGESLSGGWTRSDDLPGLLADLKDTAIQSLTLYNSIAKEKWDDFFTNHLGSNSTLKELVIKFQPISTLANELANALATNTTLEKLILLDDTIINYSDKKKIVDAIINNPNSKIEEISFGPDPSSFDKEFSEKVKVAAALRRQIRLQYGWLQSRYDLNTHTLIYDYPASPVTGFVNCAALMMFLIDNCVEKIDIIIDINNPYDHAHTLSEFMATINELSQQPITVHIAFKNLSKHIHLLINLIKNSLKVITHIEIDYDVDKNSQQETVSASQIQQLLAAVKANIHLLSLSGLENIVSDTASKDMIHAYLALNNLIANTNNDDLPITAEFKAIFSNEEMRHDLNKMFTALLQLQESNRIDYNKYWELVDLDTRSKTLSPISEAQLTYLTADSTLLLNKLVMSLAFTPIWHYLNSHPEIKKSSYFYDQLERTFSNSEFFPELITHFSNNTSLEELIIIGKKQTIDPDYSKKLVAVVEASSSLLRLTIEGRLPPEDQERINKKFESNRKLKTKIKFAKAMENFLFRQRYEELDAYQTTTDTLSIPTQWGNITKSHIEVISSYLENYTQITSINCHLHNINSPEDLFTLFAEADEIKHKNIKEIFFEAQPKATSYYFAASANYAMPIVTILTKRPDLTIHLGQALNVENEKTLLAAVQENPDLTRLNLLPSYNSPKSKNIYFTIYLNRIIRDHLGNIESSDIDSTELKSILTDQRNRRDPQKMWNDLNYFQAAHLEHPLLQSAEFIAYLNYISEQKNIIVNKKFDKCVSGSGKTKTFEWIVGQPDNVSNPDDSKEQNLDGLVNYLESHLDVAELALHIAFDISLLSKLSATNICSLKVDFQAPKTFSDLHYKNQTLDNLIAAIPYLQNIVKLEIRNYLSEENTIAILENAAKNPSLRYLFINGPLNAEGIIALEKLLITNPFLEVQGLTILSSHNLDKKIAARNSQNKRYANSKIDNIILQNLLVIQHAIRIAKQQQDSESVFALFNIKTRLETFCKIENLMMAIISFNGLCGRLKLDIDMHPNLANTYLQNHLIPFSITPIDYSRESQLSFKKHYSADYDQIVFSAETLSIADMHAIEKFITNRTPSIKHPYHMKYISLSNCQFDKGALPVLLNSIKDCYIDWFNLSNPNNDIHSREDIISIAEFLKHNKLSDAYLNLDLTEDEMKIIITALETNNTLTHLEFGETNPQAKMLLLPLLDQNKTIKSIKFAEYSGGAASTEDIKIQKQIDEKLHRNFVASAYAEHKKYYQDCCKGTVLSINTKNFLEKYNVAVNLDVLYTFLLVGNPAITQVQIIGSAIAPCDPAKDFAAQFKNTNATHLTLENFVGLSGGQFAELLAPGSKLTELVIKETFAIGAFGAEKLADVLQENTVLEKFSLVGTGLSREDKGIITKAIIDNINNPESALQQASFDTGILSADKEINLRIKEAIACREEAKRNSEKEITVMTTETEIKKTDKAEETIAPKKTGEVENTAVTEIPETKEESATESGTLIRKSNGIYLFENRNQFDKSITEQEVQRYGEKSIETVSSSLSTFRLFPTSKNDSSKNAEKKQKKDKKKNTSSKIDIPYNDNCL